MYGYNLNISKKHMRGIRCNTGVEQFIQVTGDLGFAHDQEFAGKIAEATFFKETHKKTIILV